MREVKEEKVESEKTNRNGENKKKIIFPIIIAIILIIIIILFISAKGHGSVKTHIKTTLDSIVEKSDLETANITYNVIAKRCKDDKNCDKASNDIDDFKYVVSCKGTITAGIDFKKIDVNVDEKKKKIIITMPDATIKGDPNIGSIKFLNGKELGASELPDARKLCQETVKEKSEKDNKLIPAAKEQARVVLEEFYGQWIKAYDSSYTIEVK